MHSPVTDDYAGLVAPWHPITDLFLKDPPNLNSRIEFDNNTKVSGLASITGYQASVGLHYIEKHRYD